MKCPRCQQENPPQAKFCLECAASLAPQCTNCGTQLPAGAKFCFECATPVGGPGSVSRFTSPQTYTPKHLAERIINSKAALEGERKQVTVLFADLKGSMELLADRDPEEARKLLDPVIEQMMEAVHRYEGTVNQVMGDGIMALFGAPVAHEDHAVRACYAALRMQESVKRYAADIRRTEGIPLQIRVGLNSGEVVVRSIGSDLRMDYSAVGQTTHLAARMEQNARPGTIALTAATMALVEGFAKSSPLGPVHVKGVTEPIEVFELVGSGSARTRLEASASRGLTRFVGRQAEFGAIISALERAEIGQGQVVALMGEPGVGKSRLIWEVTHSRHLHNWLVMQGGATSYGKATSFLPIIDILKSYFGIAVGDLPTTASEKLTSKVLSLDESLRPAVPALLSLLGLPVDDEVWRGLQPSLRRLQTLDAIKRLLLRESQIQPVLLVLEDLQWIDSETQAAFNLLVDGIPTARMLLIVDYRPDYRHDWVNKTYYAQLRIDPLSTTSADELLQAVLGEGGTLQGLKEFLIERTEGNPFFLEESVHSLVDAHTLVGEHGSYRLADPLSDVRVPATVQAVLAARVDRLEPQDKRLLQAAAVVGKDVPLAVLQAIVDAPGEWVRESIARLQIGGFLYELGSSPEPAYTFKHGLTRDVVYEGLLGSRRRELHAAVARAFEHLHSHQLDELAAILAHHFEQAGDRQTAISYLVRAGDRARASYANAEAITLYQAAASHLSQLRAAEAHFAIPYDRLTAGIYEGLGDVLEFTGRHDEARTAYLHALGGSGLAPRGVARCHRKVGNTLASQRRYEEALRAYEVADTALETASAAGRDREWWQAWLHIQLDRMMMHYWLAEVQNIAELTEKARPIVQEYATPTERGDFYQRLVHMALRQNRYVISDETLANAQAAVGAAQDSGRLNEIAVARFLLGFCHLWRWEAGKAAEQLEAAFNISDRTGDVTHRARCLTYLTIASRQRGRVAEARDYVSRSQDAAADAQMPEYIGTAEANAAWVAWREGDLANAKRRGRSALDTWAQLPAGHASCSFQWTALWPLIGVALAEDRVPEAADLVRRLLAIEQQPPPDQISSILCEAILAEKSGRIEDARADLQRAAESAQKLGYL